MSFDPDMTYWQTFRIILKGLVRWPLDKHEVGQMFEYAYYTGVIILTGFIRIIALLLLPISAPLFTLLVQAERKKRAERIAKAKQDFRKKLFQTREANWE